MSELVGLATKGLRPEISPFVLARDEVCYVGDPVASCFAEDRYLAEDAASRVACGFQPLAAVSDCRAAARGGAPPFIEMCRQYSCQVYGQLWRL